jgi:hypothetical protein
MRRARPRNERVTDKGDWRQDRIEQLSLRERDLIAAGDALVKTISAMRPALDGYLDTDRPIESVVAWNHIAHEAG